MSRESKTIYKAKKSAEERQNDYFKEISPDYRLKSAINLIELCLKLNKLSKSYDPRRITH